MKKLLCLAIFSLSLISPVLAEENTPAERGWLVGLALYQQNDFALAQKRLSQFLEEAPEHPAAAQAQYLLAMCGYQQKNWAAAADDFIRLQSDYPNNNYRNEANFYRAVCLYKLQKYAEAELILQNLSQRDLDRDFQDKVWLWLGETYFAQKKWDEALAAWKKIDLATTSLPDPELVLYDISWVYLQKGEPLAAVKYFSQVTKDTTSGRLALSAKETEARALLEAKLYDRAIAAYQELIDLDDSQKYSASARFGLAEAYFYLEKYDQARTGYSFVTKNFPDSSYAPGAWYGLGWITLKNGDWETAAASFEYVWQKYPQNRQHWQAGYYLVTCYAKLGQLDASKKIIDQLLASASGKTQQAQLHLGLAKIYYEEKKYPEAAAEADQALAGQPAGETAAEALNIAGKSYYQEGQYQKALQSFSALLKQTKDLTVKDFLLYKIGLSHYRLNNYAAAAQSWESLAQEMPWSDLAYDSLFLAAEAYYQNSQYDKAWPIYEKVITDKPKSQLAEKATYGAAFCLLKKGQDNLAIAKLGSLVQAWPTGTLAPLARLKIGDIYFNRGNLPEAAANYQKVISLYPKTDERLTAQFQLGWIELREENFSAAAERFLALARSFPGSAKAPEAIYWTGWAYFRQENYSQAIAVWADLKRSYPDSPFSDQATKLIADSNYNLSHQKLPAKAEPAQSPVVPAGEVSAKTATAPALPEEKGSLLEIPDIIVTGRDEFKTPSVEKETGQPAAPSEKEMPSLETKEQGTIVINKIIPGEPHQNESFKGLNQIKLSAGLPGAFGWSGYSVQKFSGLDLLFNLDGDIYGGPIASRRQNALSFNGLIDFDLSPQQIFSLGAGADQAGRGVQQPGGSDSQNFLSGNFNLFWQNELAERTRLTGRLDLDGGQFQPLSSGPAFRDIQARAKAACKADWSGQLMTAGLDLQYEKLAAGNASLATLSLQDGLTLDQLNLEAGLDLTWDKDLANLSTLYLLPQLNLAWQLSGSNLVYFKFQTACRPMTFAELYAKNLNAGINAALRYPVTVWAPALGYKQKLGPFFDLDLSLWQAKIQNFVIWTDPDSDGLWTPANIGEAQKQGATIVLTANPGQNLTSSLTYTYTDATNNSQPGQTIPYEPKHKAVLDLVYSYKPWELLIKTSLDYIGERFVKPIGGTSLPAYLDLDFYAAKDWGSWGVFLQADNVLDTDYNVFQAVQAPGRIIKLGVMAVF